MHIYKHIFTVKNGKTLSISTVRSFQRYAYKNECCRNGFTFFNNGAITENDLWVDGIHLQESGKRIIANNLINSFNHFLESANPFRWYL